MSDKSCQETDKANPDTALSSNQGNYMQAAKLSPPAGGDVPPPIESGTK